MWSGYVALDKLDKNTSEWHNTVHDEYGGVGAPVGLTVFKTAGGSLGAVPGGFDSHTPLPLDETSQVGICHLTHRFWRFPKPMLPFPLQNLCFPTVVKKRCIILLHKFDV